MNALELTWGQEMELADQRELRRSQRLDEVMRAIGDKTVARFDRHDEHGYHYIVHKSTRCPGKWQCTGLDNRGPYGHTDHQTQREAVGAAIGAHPKGFLYNDGDESYELTATS